jgi:hypothetical protein
MHFFRYGIAALAVLAVPPAGTASLEDVLPRVATYVSDFIPRFANVVAVETYEQYTFLPTQTPNGTIRERVVRRLRSDLLLVRYPLGDLDWIVFRDVSEVDAKPLGHAEGRLIKLFTESVDNPEEQAAQIALESVRYHIPGGSFAITNPLLVVALVQRHYQPRLKFVLGGEDRSLRAGIQVLKFEEREESQPPFRDDSSPRGKVPALLGSGRIRGNVWVELATGRIVKTEARVGTGVDLSTTITTFVPNERLGIMVPSEMRTTWPYRGRGSLQRIVNGVATYGDFRRFEVRTDVTAAPARQR